NIYVEKWLCHLYAEQDLKNGNLSPDEFAEAIENCNAVYETDINKINKQDTLPGDDDSPGDTSDDTPAPNLTIIPNPNAGIFTVEVYCEAAGSKIKINNIYGQPVRTINLTDDGQQSVQVSGLAQGQYTVYYLENGAVQDSENMVVE
ncbi:MAG: T9SS type A sorting domain-containing protein, partial [Bacteroidota bacterium]|nr:T9SS type A sorting domain-containing protein [Bacteroidota bacterium]